MNERTVLPMVLVMALLAILLFAADGKAQAEAPQWKKGDEWSMGYEADLGEMISSLIGSLEEEDEFGSVEHDIKGTTGYYMVFRIADVTDTQYTMDISTGGGMVLDGSMKVITEMPEEGTYRFEEWDFEPPMETKEISIEIDLEVSLRIDGTAHFTKETHRLEDLEMQLTLKGSVDIALRNFPQIDHAYDEETYEEIMTVVYTDMDVSGSADIKVTLSMSFDPPLDLFNFPIIEEEEWVAESNVTISGTYQGILDAEGLPEEMIEDMLEEDMALPIILEEMDTGIEEMGGGIIEEQVIPLSLRIRCTGTEMVTLADGSSREAYVIQFGDDDSYDEYYFDDEQWDDHYYDEDQGEDDPFEIEEDNFGSTSSDMKFLYCPEEGFFVSANMEGIEDIFGMDGLSDQIDPFELRSMRSKDAEKNMGAFKADGSGSDDNSLIELAGISILTVIVIIIAVIAVVVIIAGMVFVLKKGRSKK